VQNQITVQGGATPYAITGGLPTVMTGTSTTASMTISATVASDNTSAIVISAGSASWAVSNGNAINGYSGGTTLPGSATIHMYVCQGGSGTGYFASTVFGLSPGSAPAGYNTYIRRIFSFTTKGSGAPQAYTAIETYGGGYIAYFSALIQDISTVIAATKTNYAVSVPSDTKFRYVARSSLGGAPGSVQSVWFFSPDESSASGPADLQFTDASSNLYVTTNTSSQIAAMGNAFNSTTVTARGFEDWRRS
jgi:hypothetical protein